MRKGFRVLVTENCNANCPSCFNSMHRTGRDMDKKDFFSLCDYLAHEGKIERLKMMGGEPTVHPNFEELVSYAQSVFRSVHIFSNGINDRIGHIRLRERDSVIYNLSCMSRSFPDEKFLLDQPGMKQFEIQISSDSDIGKLKEALLRVKEAVPVKQVAMALTLNCVEDIFEKRDIIIAKWNDMKWFIKKEFGIDNQIDHGIPFCFFEGTDMDIEVKSTTCVLACTGLVDSSFNLHHCNQIHEKLVNIKEEVGFIPYARIEELLQSANEQKHEFNLRNHCEGCERFMESCNGGCFMHKL